MPATERERFCQHIALSVQKVNCIFTQFRFKTGNSGVSRFEFLIKGKWNGEYLR